MFQICDSIVTIISDGTLEEEEGVDGLDELDEHDLDLGDAVALR